MKNPKTSTNIRIEVDRGILGWCYSTYIDGRLVDGGGSYATRNEALLIAERRQRIDTTTAKKRSSK